MENWLHAMMIIGLPTLLVGASMLSAFLPKRGHSPLFDWSFRLNEIIEKQDLCAYWELHQAKRIGLSLWFMWLFVHYRYQYSPQRLDDFFGIILIGTHVTLLIGTFILLYRALINLFRGWDHFKASPDADKFRLKLERLGHDGNEGMFGENGSVNKKH